MISRFERKGLASISALALAGVFIGLVGFSGCNTLPDPNDPNQAGVMLPDVLQANLKAASDVVNDRVASREITDERGQEMLAGYARDLSRAVPVTKIERSEAWRYAEVFRTARLWKEAKSCYEVALEKPLNDDRRINDTLRYAQVLANLGQVEEALAQVAKTFDAQPKARAPILMATLYEVTPAAEGKGHDEALADTIMTAAEMHATTVVSQRTTEGLAFLMARNHHLRKAIDKAVSLYRKVGKEAKAESALKHLESLQSLSAKTRRESRAPG